MSGRFVDMINILYEDKDIIVCEKKAGVPVQSDKTFDKDMVSDVLNYRKERGEELYCAVINRLDKPVTGIVLFAKNKKCAAILSQKEDYTKYYVAVVAGTFDKEKGVLEDYLIRDGKTNTSRVTTKEAGKLSQLEYNVIATAEYKGNVYSLVGINLLTGRHHQIRVQFSSRGHALFGDRKYGGVCERGIDIALCASSLKFEHPVSGAPMEFEIKPSGRIFSIFGEM